MKAHPSKTRAEVIISALIGPDREVPTIGMIAAGTRYSRSYISYLFNGRRQGAIDSIGAIAGYLGVSMDALHGALRKPWKEAPVRKRPRGKGALARLRASRRGRS